MPREDVEAELEQVRLEKTRLEMEEQLLSQVLMIHQWDDNGTPGARDTLDAAAAAAPAEKRANVSANVLTVVRNARGAALSPANVQELLIDRGVHADLNAIRVALRRWSDRNQIIKEGHVYRALGRDAVSNDEILQQMAYDS